MKVRKEGSGSTPVHLYLHASVPACPTVMSKSHDSEVAHWVESLGEPIHPLYCSMRTEVLYMWGLENHPRCWPGTILKTIVTVTEIHLSLIWASSKPHLHPLLYQIIYKWPAAHFANDISCCHWKQLWLSLRLIWASSEPHVRLTWASSTSSTLPNHIQMTSSSVSNCWAQTAMSCPVDIGSSVAGERYVASAKLKGKIGSTPWTM